MIFNKIFNKKIKNKNLEKIIKTTNKFLRIPSVTLYEKPFLDYLYNKINKLDYELIKHSKYLVVNPITKPKYIFTIHIDRNGIIKNDFGKYEISSFYGKKKKGDTFHRDDKEFYQIVGLRYVNNNIISYNPENGKKYIKYKIINYNASSYKKRVIFDLNKKPKDYEKVFMLDSKIFTYKYFISGQIDNIISVAVIYNILKEINNKKLNSTIIFTTEEEIGNSYNYILSYLNSKNIFKYNRIIVLDTTPYENFAKKPKNFLTLRKGDFFGKFNLGLTNEIENKLKKLNINIDYKDSDIGKTELGRIILSSKNNLTGTTIQIPSVSYHTIYETCFKKSLISYYKIIKKLLEE